MHFKFYLSAEQYIEHCGSSGLVSCRDCCWLSFHDDCTIIIIDNCSPMFNVLIKQRGRLSDGFLKKRNTSE